MRSNHAPNGRPKSIELRYATPTNKGEWPGKGFASPVESNIQQTLASRVRLTPVSQEAEPAAVNGSETPCRAPLLSVVILNYNGGPWLERCLISVRNQTLFKEIEVVVADNASEDGSEMLAAHLLEDWPRAQVRSLGANFGYSEGNNRAAFGAKGRYLFFLNADTWLEPDCLEQLLREMQAAGAVAVTPMVMNYADDGVQFASYAGFDLFGLLSAQTAWSKSRELFVAGGCSLLIEADWFHRLGGFDAQFFMYADEYDLCWRIWAAGGKIVLAHLARLHHRSAASVNPRGGCRIEEIRTSDTKRYYANRNNLLVLLKNSQHLLLLLVPLQVGLVAIEATAISALARRWSHFQRSLLEPIRDCWKLRGHVVAERRRLKNLRRKGDFWILRFLRFRFNRWDELRRCRRLGIPKVDPK
ncbi:MAG: hypothetical protein C5B50_30550 [Verrucomicrobia bacterium]|nr:MAG: hypothetical protein C5B50_30550 [Verrucomicrobiota bacterium]